MILHEEIKKIPPGVLGNMTVSLLSKISAVRKLEMISYHETVPRRVVVSKKTEFVKVFSVDTGKELHSIRNGESWGYQLKWTCIPSDDDTDLFYKTMKDGFNYEVSGSDIDGDLLMKRRKMTRLEREVSEHYIVGLCFLDKDQKVMYVDERDRVWLE